MIGQTSLQNQIKTLIQNNTFPRFTILEGPRGGGKSMISEMAAKELGCHFVRLDDIGVASLRELMTQAYKLTEPTLYLIPNAQNMSSIAQNSLLKFTEEPPNNAYIILTAESKNQLLDTIRSRGSSLHLDVYTISELQEFADSEHVKIPVEYEHRVFSLCETPAEIKYLAEYGLEKFFSFVDLVYDNIALVDGSNALKIAETINLTNEENDRVELKMFWKAFINTCLDNLADDPVRNALGARITSKAIQELRVVGANKQMCFDVWLLDIRQEWL